MARGTQLIKLVEMLRGELSRATSVAVGVDDARGLMIKLRRAQEMIYDGYDWPFLRERFYFWGNRGERYYDVPAGLNLERIEEVVLFYNNLPRHIERGIDEVDFASFNSDNGVVADPPLKWDVRWLAGNANYSEPPPAYGEAPVPTFKEQIEIWPIPASTKVSKFVFRGIRALRPLIADSDVADLDDQAIVLTCAAELLEKGGAPNFKSLAGEANRRIAEIKGRQRAGDRRYRMAMGNTGTGKNTFRIVVRTS